MKRVIAAVFSLLTCNVAYAKMNLQCDEYSVTVTTDSITVDDVSFKRNDDVHLGKLRVISSGNKEEKENLFDWANIVINRFEGKTLISLVMKDHIGDNVALCEVVK